MEEEERESNEDIEKYGEEQDEYEYVDD